MERTIGVIKNRFRCLLGARQLHYKPQKVAQIVNVCCALHNICVHYKIATEDTPSTDQIEDNQETQESFSSEDDASSFATEAIRIRQEILQSF